MKRSALVRRTRLEPKSKKLKKEVPDWKRVSERVRSEPTGPDRDPAFLDFVRRQRCLTCGRRKADPHHWGKRGKSQKCSDYMTVPLCREHHTEFHTTAAIAGTERLDLLSEWARVSVRLVREAVDSKAVALSPSDFARVTQEILNERK